MFVAVPESAFNALDQTPVDASILKSGSVSAYAGEQLDLLNSTTSPMQIEDLS